MSLPGADGGARTAGAEALPTLTAIVPVSNERPLVGRLLARLFDVDLPSVEALEVIAVDDGSTDGSRELLEGLAAGRDDLRLVVHELNRRKGAALRSGIAAATGDLVVFQDADLESASPISRLRGSTPPRRGTSPGSRGASTP